jgi:hypothetical protein
MLQLERATPILGTTFIERMTGAKHAILRIGNEAFTRHELVTRVGTGNFRAARILSDLCKTLNLTSVKDLYMISPYELAGTHGIGVTTLFVLMSLFEAKGLDVMKWYGKSYSKGESAVSFDSLKHRAAKRDVEAAQREKAATKRVKGKRHHANVGAFLAENAPKAKRVQRVQELAAP